MSVLVWLGLGGVGREESLGRRLPPQTQLFLFLRGSKLLRGRGYTPHGQLKSENIIPAQHLIFFAGPAGLSQPGEEHD